MAAVRVFGPPALPSPAPLTDQAAAWAEHVLATSDLPPVGACPERTRRIYRKALDAVAFSLRHGLRDLAVPSKLVGVAAHQLAVESLAPHADLPVHDRPRLVVSHTLDVHAVRSDRTLRPLGRIQPKHAAWLAPLLGRGATVHLHRVTGLNADGSRQPVTRGVTRRSTERVYKTLGVNVRISGLSRALDTRASRPPSARLAPTRVAEASAPYDASGRGGEASPQVLAVRLWRDADGTARMTCPHVVRHSPSGPEWGYRGSGPADCARSVLLALVDEATAESHYQAFKDEVVALLPEHGAVVQRTVVLAWLSGPAGSVDRRAA